MRVLVTRTLERQQFDVIVASEVGIGTCTSPYVRKMRGIPRVIEDLELSMIESQIRTQRTKLKRMRRQLTWWKLRHYAARLLPDLDGCTVVSERERQTVLDMLPGYGPLEVVPNGVAPDYCKGDFGIPQPNTLVYQGALTYAANFDAMAFFLRHVLPRIRAKQPAVKLYITGRTDGVPVERLPLDDGVVLTGYLEDVRSIVARSAVTVVPLALGGGTRLKILEAMALGRPVVSTTKGAEGLEVCAGEDILIADDPAEFAGAVLRLLADQELQMRIGVRGQTLANTRYSWNGIAERFDRFLDQVVQEHKRRRAV